MNFFRYRCHLAIFATLAISPSVCGVAIADKLCFDFEKGDLQGWKVVAGDYPSPVCRYGEIASEKLPKSGRGDYYLTTSGTAVGKEGPDPERMGGIIESPVFVVEGDEMTFQLGGVSAKVTLHTVDGKEVRAAAQWAQGFYKPVRWNVSDLKGERVFLRLIDPPESGYAMSYIDAIDVEGNIDQEATNRRRQEICKTNEQNLSAAQAKIEELGEIVFTVRQPGKNGHYYVNFGNWCHNPNMWEYGNGGRLCRLDVRSGNLTTIIDDPEGGVRDPQVHYDGRKILFSYRPGGTNRYHLYEVNIDGTDLVQLTDGPYDDIEPTYLPNGRIMFCSTRCNRIVNCNLVQVALLFTCDGDGSKIRQISPNNETENTPWLLPDGRIMYTRWEYIDRGIGGFKALWTTNPDGTGQATFYGNMNPAPTFLDAKPIPGTHKVVMINSTHMGREHVGTITTFDTSVGPDDRSTEQTLAWEGDFRDPYPIGKTALLAARCGKIVLIGNDRSMRTIFELSEEDQAENLWCHEPRPLVARPREPVIPPKIDLTKETGTLMVADVYQGRNMAGVKRGEIKQILVMETLPKAVNFSGRADPYSFDHSFNLNRVLGTVPVEPDGSACFEVPAMRGIILTALDEDGLAVKRMQSFLSVQPGETAACIGCHEDRTLPPVASYSGLQATSRAPSHIEPIAGVPDVFDFPRDIQPILDKHCVVCHNYDATEQGGPMAGGVILSGDHGPTFSHSFATLHMRDLVVVSRDGKGNRPPRGFGSGASPLIGLLDGDHHDVKLSDHEQRMIKRWIDASATYAGTCVASGTGRFPKNPKLASQAAADAALRNRCNSCHSGQRRLPINPDDAVGIKGYTIVKEELPRRFSHHRVYNLTRPEKSLILLAPLAKSAGGYGICHADDDRPIFAVKSDPDYVALLQLVQESKTLLDADPRFDQPDFLPSTHYIRAMQTYGILPRSLDPQTARVDPYETDRAYWRSFWHQAR